MVEKKYIRIGVVSLAVTALVIGLSVGITESQKKNTNTNDVANVSTSMAEYSTYDNSCASGYSGKSGKSGGGYGGSEGSHNNRQRRRTQDMSMPTPDTCQFCPGGLDNPDLKLPTDDGATCLQAKEFASTLLSTDTSCATLKSAETFCCTIIPCQFCPDGLNNPGLELPTGLLPSDDGNTCSLAKDLASTFLSTDTICATVKLAETFCCPITENPTGNPTTRPTSSKSKSGKSDNGSTKSGKHLVKGKSGKSSVSLDSLDIQRSVLTKYNLSNHTIPPLSIMSITAVW